MMKVLLVNGSPHENGCTYTALSEVESALKDEGIECEIFWIGHKPLPGCISCGNCGDGHCVLGGILNDFLTKARQADGFIFGSPVYYAGAAGSMKSFMDRAFHASGGMFRLKPAAAIVSARRAGTSTALDDLTKYFTISEMPVVSSCYWNNVHGNSPGEVRQDEEGLFIMRTLGKNMAWLLKCIDAGRNSGILPPQKVAKINTNFIR